VKRDGTIVARYVRAVYNTGAYGALKPSEDGLLTGVDYAAGPYRVPNFQVEGFCVYSNQPPCGYMRAPGHPQIAFALEAHTDLVARELGMDPVEFRERTVVAESPTGAQGLASEALRQAAAAIGWTPAPTPRPSPTVGGGDGERARPARPKLVGRGIALVERGIGFGEGSSDITLNPDGTLTVVSGLPDNGTGATTVVAQVVAEEFGVPIERVQLVRGTTDALPVDVGSAADRMTNVAGNIAIAASRKLQEQLAPLAAKMLGAEAAEWDGSGWRPAAPDDLSPQSSVLSPASGRRVSLEELATEMVRPGDPVAHVQVTMVQPRSLDRAYCAQAVEVEVDPETGQVRLRKIVTVQDTGTIINPLGHQGQIEGGLVQGIGFALSEEMVLDNDGRVSNAHLGEYKMPTMPDIPELVTMNLPSEGPGPFQAKSIGEMPCVPIAGAIANAVADAIGAPILQLPITAERVLEAIAPSNPV
jgi:CO/xanthine dehydrogenase Mo-binding subunit